MGYGATLKRAMAECKKDGLNMEPFRGIDSWADDVEIVSKALDDLGPRSKTIKTMLGDPAKADKNAVVSFVKDLNKANETWKKVEKKLPDYSKAMRTANTKDPATAKSKSFATAFGAVNHVASVLGGDNVIGKDPVELVNKWKEKGAAILKTENNKELEEIKRRYTAADNEVKRIRGELAKAESKLSDIADELKAQGKAVKKENDYMVV